LARVLVAYISGHGFGHWTRSEAVLSRVAAAGVPVHVRTNERALAPARKAAWPASVTETDVGPGVVQRGPLELDIGATEEILAEHVGRLEALAAREAEALFELGADLVYADVPPVAFEAAAQARLPAIGLANFTWSWIYEHYVAERPAFAGLASRLASAESRARRFLRLPFGGGFERLPRVEQLPLVVRAPTRSRTDARSLLPVPLDEKRPIVLLSFGGFGAELDLARAARANAEFFFVAFSQPAEPVQNVAALPHDHDLPHQDLVLGADAILGKPGYGTVAEAIVARRPFVLTPRGDFREFAELVRGVEENLAHARLSLDELAAGRWRPALERALAMTPPQGPPRIDGAEIAARRILEALDLHERAALD
jgi:hypothetical protein